MSKHKLSCCELCEEVIFICYKCGNNTCNAGYGTLPDGSICDACPSAYEEYEAYHITMDKVRFDE